MNRILVVWEDERHQALDELVRERTPATGQLELLFYGTGGNRNFQGFATARWPDVRAKGLPTNPGAIHHAICVVDGDRLREFVSSVGVIPVSAADIPRWHSHAETEWQKWLDGYYGSSPSGLHGIVLRWAKESIVLAAYDDSLAKTAVGLDVRLSGASAHISSCVPSPPSVPDADFTNTFRDPLTCIRDLFLANGRQCPRKNNPVYDDLIRDIARHRVTAVYDRVPDIDRVVQKVQQLAGSSAPQVYPVTGGRPTPTPT